MKNFQNKRNLQVCLLVLIAVVTLGIGYAAISAINLIINGNATASVNQNNFKVYFTSTEDTPSLTGNVTVEGTAEINSQDNTVATFNVGGLTKVGDYAIAAYTVLNDSEAIGAELSLNVTSSNSEYFKVTETILDNKLQAGETTTATVKVEMIKTPITDSVTTSVTARLTASPLENELATGGSSLSKVKPGTFAGDSWTTILENVRNNDTSAYHVGDTKTVEINGNDYTLRIANKTTGEHCGDNDTAYSQTACGFVVEFADVITTMAMAEYEVGNSGGYPSTYVYSYLNNTLYEQLPNDLQIAIKPTRVISGYGCTSYDLANMICNSPLNNGNNYVTTDKLFIFSGMEIWGPYLENGNYFDSAEGTTTQLDYYRLNNVSINSDLDTGTNLDIVKKRILNGDYFHDWWLRNPDWQRGFGIVSVWGSYSYASTQFIHTGVSPAFRIG